MWTEGVGEMQQTAPGKIIKCGNWSNPRQAALLPTTYIRCVQVTYWTKWKAKGAEHIVRFGWTPVSRVMIFTCSAKFTISCPHVILALRLPWPLRESMFLLIIAWLYSWGRVRHVRTTISNCRGRSMVPYAVHRSSLNSLLCSTWCYRVYWSLHQTEEFLLGAILSCCMKFLSYIFLYFFSMIAYATNLQFTYIHQSLLYMFT